MNAASHAYRGGRAASRWLRTLTRTGVALTVKDNGDGIHPRPAEPEVSRRLGILLIAALASWSRSAAAAARELKSGRRWTAERSVGEYAVAGT